MLDLISQITDTQEYIFTRIKNNSSYFMMESQGLDVGARLREYLRSKDDILPLISKENFAVINSEDPGDGTPTLVVINKKIINSADLATAIEVICGVKIKSEFIEKNPVIVLARKKDTKPMLVTMGMKVAYEMWLRGK